MRAYIYINKFTRKCCNIIYWIFLCYI